MTNRRVAVWCGEPLTERQEQLMRAAVARVRDDGEAVPVSELGAEIGMRDPAMTIFSLMTKGLLACSREPCWHGKGQGLVVRGILDEHGDWYEPIILAPGERAA